MYFQTLRIYNYQFGYYYSSRFDSCHVSRYISRTQDMFQFFLFIWSTKSSCDKEHPVGTGHDVDPQLDL